MHLHLYAMLLFWVFWSIDAIVALIALYFFFIGLADGSVSSVNITIWAALLAALAALLIGTLYLKSGGNMTLAKILTGILAIPALLAALAIVVMVASGTKWN